MSYGDYSGPNKPDKGVEGGSCNRTRCQSSPALWYNHGARSWYCADCRHDIESVNQRDWERLSGAKDGHPMFETREMIDTRQQGERS